MLKLYFAFLVSIAGNAGVADSEAPVSATVNLGPPVFAPMSRQTPKDSKLRMKTFKEIDKMTEDSPLKYTTDSIDKHPELKFEQAVEIFWPSAPECTNRMMNKVDVSGQAQAVEYPFESECISMLNGVEKASKQNDCEIEKLAKILNKFPKCYLPLLKIGECERQSRHFEKSLAAYKKAAELNPFDHEIYFEKGRAEFDAGQFDKARASWSKSLALRPRSKQVLDALEAAQKKLNIELFAKPFVPKALVIKKGKDLFNYLPGSKLDPVYHWYAYGIVKAVWIGEAAHREAMIGMKEHLPNTREEHEALFHMANMYKEGRERKLNETDETAQRVLDVKEAGYLDEFIVYELMSRIEPNAVIAMDQERRNRMEEFVSKFVVVVKVK